MAAMIVSNGEPPFADKDFIYTRLIFQVSLQFKLPSRTFRHLVSGCEKGEFSIIFAYFLNFFLRAITAYSFRYGEHVLTGNSHHVALYLLTVNVSLCDSLL